MDHYAYNSAIDELSTEEEEEEEETQGQVLRKRKKNSNNNDDSKFKSKNLTAERNRRAKLNERLLHLRTLVPIITNMTKANIIKDAITYIEELKRQVEELSNELLEIPESHQEREIKPVKDEDINTGEEMKNWGIKPEVKLIPIDDNKLWMKVVYQKTMGRLTKVIEAVNRLGFDFNDINFTTSKGAAILTSCLEGTFHGSFDVEETKELLKNVTSSV